MVTSRTIVHIKWPELWDAAFVIHRVVLCAPNISDDMEKKKEKPYAGHEHTSGM